MGMANYTSRSRSRPPNWPNGNRGFKRKELLWKKSGRGSWEAGAFTFETPTAIFSNWQHRGLGRSIERTLSFAAYRYSYRNRFVQFADLPTIQLKPPTAQRVTRSAVVIRGGNGRHEVIGNSSGMLTPRPRTMSFKDRILSNQKFARGQTFVVPAYSLIAKSLPTSQWSPSRPAGCFPG